MPIEEKSQCTRHTLFLFVLFLLSTKSAQSVVKHLARLGLFGDNLPDIL